MAVLDERAHRALGCVDRDREAHAAVVSGPRLAADLGVDPDHPATRVEQRPARVAVRDRRVRLDRVDDVVPGDGQRLDRAVNRGDNADRKGILVS